MLNVEDMPFAEMQALLQQVGFGHLGCAHNNRPYVVPIHYAYDSQDIYFFTTEGTKTEYIADNPEVCLQVEEVRDAAHWRSVMVNGRAERITEPEALEHAMQLITERNPTLTPALNLTQLDTLGRANITAIYRVHPHTVDGRKTV
jgi:nitroimidazol reductase NimA-like FMN-containing flavoprotein (pyridoxamine 5'-phosphate oxidase superfamily)